MNPDSLLSRPEPEGAAAHERAASTARADGSSFPVYSRIDGTLVGTAPDMGADEAEAAIRCADAAWSGWRSTSAKERAQLLHAWSAAIQANAAELADLIVREQGKTPSQAAGEVTYGASFVDWYAEEGRRIYGEVIHPGSPHQRIFVSREPIGVCAAITPWNYPVAMVTRKIAPALAAGCTVVLKPAESTPLTALFLARLAAEAGIPEGVLSIVTAADPAPIGEVFARSPLVRHLSFTGSVPVGRLLLRMAADTVKKCTMELGGNAPFIIFEDADIDRAVDGLIQSKFRNSGQTCVCPNRVLVHSSVYERVAAAAAERSAGLRLFEPDGPRDAELGPLISAAAAARIRGLVAEAVGGGAVEHLAERSREQTDTFMSPVILGGVTPSMKIYGEEVFGPVICLTPFDDEAEAVALANDTAYGLAAYLFTRDLSRALRVADALQFGMVGVNEVVISQDTIPFGGIKQSGLGRESSKHGIDEYLELKTLCVAL
jgi:succinate-semialdehyde dehydrogenase/glutarate-semialdehyde dehydrogenase